MLGASAGPERNAERARAIRGSDGGRRTYGIGDTLPAVYAQRCQIQISNERVAHAGACERGR